MTAWAWGLLGGVMIGISACVLLLFNGRIAGISGIVYGLVREGGERAWRLAFLAGLMLAGGLTMWLSGQDSGSPAKLPVLVVAGLLVGFGTRLGHGCTSGHGVCGLGRLSGRSLAAVATFMASAIVTVALVRMAGIAP